MHRPWITNLAVVLVTAVITTALVSPWGGETLFRQSREIRLVRGRVQTLEELAKDQDATIQAMQHEVQQLRGELKRALERLEAAR